MTVAEPIRDAATVILARRDASGIRVLMGQRGAKAVFMPSKYVFPGGGVSAEDGGEQALASQALAPLCQQRLAEAPPGLDQQPAGAPTPGTLVAAALRELREETGLGFEPGAVRLRYMFRAITPSGNARRFDARFFLAEAEGLSGDADDFSAASDELSHLHWISLSDARALDLPFITEVALAEATNLLKGGDQPGVPFFDNSGPIPTFRRIL